MTRTGRRRRKGDCNATDGFAVCTNAPGHDGPHWDRRVQHEWPQEADDFTPAVRRDFLHDPYAGHGPERYEGLL